MTNKQNACAFRLSQSRNQLPRVFGGRQGFPDFNLMLERLCDDVRRLPSTQPRTGGDVVELKFQGPHAFGNFLHLLFPILGERPVFVFDAWCTAGNRNAVSQNVKIHFFIPDLQNV
jgi:hypothetical protein